uniref:Heat shock factor binding protein 1 n=3 Tax=Macrostomum lignano TaxID=282301 RepID=A0A1I8GC36_9PLAT
MADFAKDKSYGVVDPHNVQELTNHLQAMLQGMTDNFGHTSDRITGRIDEMGRRIDELERSVADLMTQAGVEDFRSGGRIPSAQCVQRGALMCQRPRLESKCSHINLGLNWNLGLALLV